MKCVHLSLCFWKCKILNIFNFFFFFTFYFFGSKSWDITLWAMSEKRDLFVRRHFTAFIFLFLLSDWRNERKTVRGDLFFCFDCPLFFCKRSPWCRFNRSIFFCTTGRKRPQEGELQVYIRSKFRCGNTNVSLSRFFCSFFPPRLILFLCITLLW